VVVRGQSALSRLSERPRLCGHTWGVRSKYKATATEDNIKELLEVIANAAMSDLNREDAAWALRAMTEPALAQRKRNTGLLINLGAVDPLVDMLVNGGTHGCKEQVRSRPAARCGTKTLTCASSDPLSVYLSVTQPALSVTQRTLSVT
jgi:hypothetical protein